MKVVTRDGTRRIWEYRNTLDTHAAPAPIIRGVARDVTEREEAFQTIRRSEEHFRSIIENASDVIAIVELDGRIRYESPSVERVLGYPGKALVGTLFLDLIHPEDVSRAADFLARQIADPAAIQTIELRARHHGGTWRSFEIVAKNLVKRGQASAIVVNARDITERKLLEAQLMQANRLGGLGRLAATVAHEFNNVLMGMQPFAELMQRPDATPQIISKGAWHIANSIQRGRRIVLDILRFAQPYVPVDDRRRPRRMVGDLRSGSGGRARKHDLHRVGDSPRPLRDRRSNATLAGSVESRGQCARCHAFRRNAHR